MWSLILVSTSLISQASADQSSNSLNAIDQPVRAVTLAADGKILIGGDFTTVQGAFRGHIARLNADGSTDFSFMNGLSGASGPVLSTGIQSDTNTLIGGEFLTVMGCLASASLV